MLQNMEYELGVCTTHPIIYAYRLVVGVMKTWIYCRKRGIQTKQWFGVYEKGTENVIAHFGNMPDAEERAVLCIRTLCKRTRND